MNSRARPCVNVALVVAMGLIIAAAGLLSPAIGAMAQRGHDVGRHRAADTMLLPTMRRSARLHLPTNPLSSPPGNFPFQTAKSPNGLIIVHFYYRPTSFGSDFENSVQQALRDYIQPTLGYAIKARVDIYVYNSRGDFLTGAQPEFPDITAAYSDWVTSTIYLPVYNGFDSFSVISHEMTHIVFHQELNVGHLQADYSLFPLWFDEGLAASDEPDYGDYGVFRRDLLQRALANGSFVDIFSIFVWTYPTNPDTDDLCYAEARSFIKYMQATYGQTKFHQFIADIKDGNMPFASEVDFGVDLQTLESDWEVSQGLPALRNCLESYPGALEAERVNLRRRRSMSWLIAA